MTPGPVYVYECPQCSTLITRNSLMSGNTFGTQLFSDGKKIFPMFREFPNLTKCKKCKTFLWLSNLKEKGTYDWGETDQPDWLMADKAEFLTIPEYFDAIDQNFAKDEDEDFFIRQRAWWAFNDRVRKGENLHNNNNEEKIYKENCLSLIKLLNSKSDYQKILLAELNRNLGIFETSISFLESIQEEELKWLKEKLITECEKKNPLVIQLHGGY